MEGEASRPPLGFTRLGGNIMRYGEYGYGLGGELISLLLTVFFWVLVISLAFWLVRKLVCHNTMCEVYSRKMMSGKTAAGQDAFDILRERYAKGEIDKTEFEEKKKALTS